MYENWIKFEKLTLEKPEVYQMAAKLKLDNHGVVGRLLVVWSWFDDHTEDGTAPDSVVPMLDARTCKGFCSAMQEVNWLNIKDGKVSISNYSKHNGASSKKRSADAARKAKHRGRMEHFCHSNLVTSLGKMSQQYCDTNRTKLGKLSQIIATFVTLARSSQFSFSFFLFQGGDIYYRGITRRGAKSESLEVSYAA